jgi:fructose-specific phosphotransferase system IIC component
VKFNSHNQYIDIIAQTGLIGFACFAWFVWQVGKLGFSLVKQAPEGFSRAYAYGALGGLAGTLVAGMLADWIIPFVYNIGFSGFRASVLGWIFLGGMVALGQIIEDSPEREASP